MHEVILALLIVNGGFEDGTTGWAAAWSRSPSIQATIDSEVKHSGAQSLRISHTGTEDWCLNQVRPIPASPGEVYELHGWTRIQGEGDVAWCLAVQDAQGKPIDWMLGAAPVKAGPAWQELRSRVTLPPMTKTILPRAVGNGPATVWLDDLELVRVGSLDDLRAKDLPEKLTVKNASLEVTLRPADATLTITDLRTKKHWQQAAQSAVVVQAAGATSDGFHLRLLDPDSHLEYGADIVLERDCPEVSVSLTGSGKLPRTLSFPQPFASDSGTLLIMPVNEGISYPVDDASLPERMHYILYGGHGLCMGWYGVTNGREGLMTLVETPDDASVTVQRRDGLLRASPEWDPHKGAFGPTRKLRYVVLDDGGYVAMCKRYREHSKQVGLLKTLAQKRQENQNVDRLVGAVNVWNWDSDPVEICRELQSAGIQRILWSRGGSPEQLKQLNEMKVLTSRYDIFQDVMDPDNFSKIRGVHKDWPTAAWPKDLMIGADGKWIKGWGVQAKDGTMLSCGVTCDARAVDYARERVPSELKTHPYLCRFIDTTTASPWRECYNPDHPVTRSESRQWKMRLLEFMSKDCGLVCGSETGHEAAVPYVHYFEGMLSIAPYRVRDAGRRMSEIVENPPEQVVKFQTGPRYRLPLWELVYHDCVVAQWYWGDYNNKLPKLWDRRDLFNALYGTPPMFMFNKSLWQQNRDRFVKSYQTTCPVARATGYHEMLSHQWLTADHTVQQSKFANGVTVTVNFGDTAYTLGDGSKLEPLGCRAEGLP